MNSRTARGRALLFAVCSLFCFAAQAGRPCLHQPATPHVLRDAAEASTKVSALLSASHEQIALLARIGQDLSKQSLLYSHAGFAVRDADGHWQVIHLLNSCGTDRGKLVSEGLLQFYLDDLLSYQTKIVFFSAQTRRRAAHGVADTPGKGSVPSALQRDRASVFARMAELHRLGFGINCRRIRARSRLSS